MAVTERSAGVVLVRPERLGTPASDTSCVTHGSEHAGWTGVSPTGSGLIRPEFLQSESFRSRATFLLLDYGRHWDFPKGHLEIGEDDHTAARRELLEETGIRLPGDGGASFDPDYRQEITYYYRGRHKRLVRKTVVFFLAVLHVHPSAVRLSHEHVGFTFDPEAVALKRLTFAGPRAVLRTAAEHLRSRFIPASGG